MVKAAITTRWCSRDRRRHGGEGRHHLWVWPDGGRGAVCACRALVRCREWCSFRRAFRRA